MSTITSPVLSDMIKEYKEKIIQHTQSIYKLNQEITDLQNKRDELVTKVLTPDENNILNELADIRDQMNTDWNNTHDATEGIDVWYIDVNYYDRSSIFGGTENNSKVDKWAIVRSYSDEFGGTQYIVGYSYNGGSGVNWDNNQTLLDLMNEWDLVYDQITHPISTDGSYGIDANISSKQDLINQLESEKAKYQSFVDQFENKVEY